MNILIVTPAAARSRQGNRVTALRWARHLRDLGHRVRVEQAYNGHPCDVLVALHARRSFDSIDGFRQRHPAGPLIVALTGTDLYSDIQNDPDARRSLELASRLVLLQPMGVTELPEHLRGKARTIYQSARPPARPGAPLKRAFEVCVMAHLRPVKDPLRAALAARLLPASSRIRVIHLGAALDDEMAGHARAETNSNLRYKWLGDVPRGRALRLLARSRLLAITSQLEGGANVVSEAIAGSVPVISSRIAGSVGMLGEQYPGYFPVGDTQALADLLWRAETDAHFYRDLKSWCERLRSLVDPARERESWARMLRELVADQREVSWPSQRRMSA
jgi:putative glycosyltransferase (TIGR04348 family)